MRTQSEIKKNNIRKANLLQESQTRNNRGKMASRFGIYEQCGTPLDMEGEYMGAPVGTEPMDMMIGGEQVDCPQCGGEGCSHCDYKGYHGMEMEVDMMMMDDDEMPMDDEMTMFMMEKKGAKPDFLDLDGDGDKTEPMKKAAKDRVTEKCGGGYGKDLEEGCGDLDEERKSSRSVETKKDGMVKNPKDQPSCAKLIVGGGGCYSCDGGRTFQSYPCGEEFDPQEFFNEGIGKRRILKESYKAVVATPSKDGWGNNFNNILTESKQVNDITSLMNRMKKVIK